MAVIKQSMFSLDAAKRHKEQESLESQLKGSPKISNRKVPMNITLPQEYKDRLTAAASSKHISASVMIQTWIDEFC